MRKAECQRDRHRGLLGLDGWCRPNRERRHRIVRKAAADIDFDQAAKRADGPSNAERVPTLAGTGAAKPSSIQTRRELS